MPKGYMGKDGARIARINLSDGSIKEFEMNEEFCRAYIGGSGFGVRFLYDEVPADTDPLSEANKIYFFTGPLVGTPAPSSGRFMVISKSPLTGIFGEANCGGNWGPMLKFAGFDGVICEGKAEKPTYIWIHEGEVELKDASALWGKDALESEDLIKKELGDDKLAFAGIGQAGENQSKMAAIINHYGRAAGRCGLGAVMGSKNLKAIACKGTKKVEMVYPDSIKDISRSIMGKLNTNPLILSMKNYGTGWFMNVMTVLEDVPIKNWHWSSLEWGGGIPHIHADKISGGAIRKTIKTKIYACYGCPIACGCHVEVKDGPYKGVKGHQPEYETLAFFGTSCLNDDLGSICKCNDICNRYGLDTISTGSTVAFAIDLFEHGILTKKDVGFDLKWGDAAAIVKLTEMIAKQEGIGATLALGTRAAAEKIGKGAIDYAVQSKGLELPAHDPRAFVSLGVHYATTARGGDHCSGFTSATDQGIIFPVLGVPYKTGRFDTEGKGMIAGTFQDVWVLFNSLTICYFAGLGYGSRDLMRMVKAVTGEDVTMEDAIHVRANRINMLKRLYNYKCGIRPKDETLPKTIMTPLKKGSTEGVVPDLETMKKEFYDYNKLTEEGIPTKERMIALKLEKEAKEFY
ncbi:MAG: aldehyde ferredoxin oxidoreductase family protein [Candidatus Helarchaeota archaeon]|nr:aldehyde ferredoxin oxidoreductase family protein [Candidatus Helarchaeota archaeon]